LPFSNNLHAVLVAPLSAIKIEIAISRLNSGTL
jgi:hypothetical protein